MVVESPLASFWSFKLYIPGGPEEVAEYKDTSNKQHDSKGDHEGREGEPEVVVRLKVREGGGTS